MVTYEEDRAKINDEVTEIHGEFVQRYFKYPPYEEYAVSVGISLQPATKPKPLSKIHSFMLALGYNLGLTKRNPRFEGFRLGATYLSNKPSNLEIPSTFKGLEVICRETDSLPRLI